MTMMTKNNFKKEYTLSGPTATIGTFQMVSSRKCMTDNEKYLDFN